MAPFTFLAVACGLVFSGLRPKRKHRDIELGA